jgi:hypothetical protein
MRLIAHVEARHIQKKIASLKFVFRPSQQNTSASYLFVVTYSELPQGIKLMLETVLLHKPIGIQPLLELDLLNQSSISGKTSRFYS